MNTDNGHLVRVDSDIARKLFGDPKTADDAMKAKMEAIAKTADLKLKMAAAGYEPVPKELEQAAEKKLAGQNEAQVSLVSGGKLSRWAAQRRKAKRKMASTSRKKNR